MSEDIDNTGKVHYLKTGGGTFRYTDRDGKRHIIKPLQKFWAYEDDIPKAFEDVVKTIGGALEGDKDELAARGSIFQKVPAKDLNEDQKARLAAVMEEIEAENQEPAKTEEAPVAEEVEPADSPDDTPVEDLETKADAPVAAVDADAATDTDDTPEVDGADTDIKADDPENYKHDRGGGWFDVINTATKKKVNESALREKDADDVLKSLNEP